MESTIYIEGEGEGELKLFYVVTITCTVLFTGCAIESTKPSELRNEITPIEYSSVKGSRIVARCVELEWKKFGNSDLKVQLSPIINGYSVWGEFNWSKIPNPFIVKDHTIFLADINDIQSGSIAHFYTHYAHGFTKSFSETVWEKCLNDVSANTITTPERSVLETPTISSAAGSHSMGCQTDKDCRDGFSCRTLRNGGDGTECRTHDIQLPPTEHAKVAEQSTQPTPLPIAEPTEQPILSKSASDEYSEIKFTKRGGVYLIPVLINDVLQMKFIIDSGASDVSISPDVFLTLIKTETIEKRDWLPGRRYQLADGSIAKSNRFKISTLKIGNRILKNVACSISNSTDAPMLLGQSALEQLGNFTFHYDTGTVRFNK